MAPTPSPGTFSMEPVPCTSPPATRRRSATPAGRECSWSPRASSRRLLGAPSRSTALVGSGRDQAEHYAPGDLDPPPRLAVWTEGRSGGRYRTADGIEGTYPAAPIPGPVVDAYGCGDSFAAGLAFALGSGLGVEDALAFASKCGAACLTGRGPYEGQLSLRHGKEVRDLV